MLAGMAFPFSAPLPRTLRHGDVDRRAELGDGGEHVVHRDDAGNPVYAELELDGCPVGVGQNSPEPTPFDLGPAAFYVAIDDPDAMHARVSQAGAEIVMPLVDQDYGSREFAARDYEGNVWCFGTYRPGAQ